ncbi:Vinculin [Eumeta japonica]|uniref:Vinculin n=1 Tax=Eumeta variegata TaxID=151549 RepID=A0A4C1SU13_EUMVA|nr:Vinculin [Eumeta japonica]
MTVKRMIVCEQMGSGPQSAESVYQATAQSDIIKELKWKQRLLPKLLTGVNSRAVTIVGLATVSGELDESELKNQVNILNEDLPDIDSGVKKLCEGDKLDDKEKSELLKQLEDLHGIIQTLTALSEENPTQKTREIAEVASKASDLSTKMLNSVDPAAKRRSKLLMNTGAPPVSGHDLTKKQRKLAKDLAVLNAATASLLASHSDPKEIDYAGAKTATDSIMEVMPKIEKDAKIIANTISNGNVDNTTVKEDLRSLLDSVQNLLEHVGSQDSEKLNNAALSLGDKTKLFYTLCSPRVESEKKNEIIALTKRVDDKTSELLLKTNELAITSEQGIPNNVDAAGGRCVDASRRLVTCAQLAAPFIYNPQCQNAMLSSTNAVASSVEDLAKSWKPLTSNSDKDQIDALVSCSMEVADALDALREVCKGMDEMDIDNVQHDQIVNDKVIMKQSPKYEAERQALLDSISIAEDKARRAITELNEPVNKALTSKEDLYETQKYISECLGRVNAAAGSLLALHTDKSKMDIPSEQAKVTVIGELLPEIAKGLKILVQNDDPEDHKRKLEETRQFCETALDLCKYVKQDDLAKMNKCAERFGESTVRVLQTVGQAAAGESEKKVIKISTKLDSELKDFLKSLSDMKTDTHGKDAVKDITSAHQKCTDAVEKIRLHIEFPNKPQQQCSMVNAIKDLECSLDDLDASCATLGNDVQAQNLHDRVKVLRDLLDRLRKTTSTPLAGPGAEAAAAMRAARDNLERGSTHPPVGKSTQRALESAAVEKLARAGAAAACLLAALSCTPEERNRRKQLAGALCDAANALCLAASKGDQEVPNAAPPKLKASSLSFGDASSDLLYNLNRDAKPDTPNQIIHTSKALAGDASDLLMCANDLTNATADPAIARSIDEAGSRCADAAETLLTCSKLTSPFLHESGARDCMFNAIQDLERSLDDLNASCAPLGNDARAQNLRHKVKALRDLLARLRDTTSAFGVPLAGPGAEAAAAMRAARDNLERGSTHPPVGKSTQRALESAAVEKLARAGAAAACLLAAHSDTKYPDVASAKEALHSLTQSVPAIVEDLNKCSASCTPEERNRRKQLAGALCDAANALAWPPVKAIRRYQTLPHPYKLKASSLSFGDASSDLLYNLNRDAKPDTANQIIHTSKALAGDASDLLMCANDLTNATADPAIARNIDEAGSRCADAAGTLLTCSKLTSPFLHESGARDCMFNAIQDLERSLDDLNASCAPLGNDARAQNLRHKVKALRDLLARLRDTTSAFGVPLAGPGAEAAAAMRAARDNLERGSTHPPVGKSTQRALESAAVEKLARAGAAAACLLAAHSDPKHPDVASAKEALHSLTQSVPAIVEDLNKCSASCTPEERNRRKQLAGALCDAANALCLAASKGDQEVPNAAPPKLKASSLSFGDASSDLLYNLNRDAKPDTANQIIHTSKALAGDASDLLMCANDLTNATADPAIARTIDEAGSRCADAAGTLLTCSKLTSPFLHESGARDCMFNAIQDLERSLDDLNASCAPLGNDARAQNLRHKVKALRDLLDRLRETTSALGVPLAGPGAEAAAAMRAARDNLERGSTHPPVGKSTQRALESAAVEKLARAGAAAACLLAAHSDPKHPDVASAKEALHSLTQSVPAVVEDLNKCSASCTPEERSRRKQLAGALCDAANALCLAASKGDQEVPNAAQPVICSARCLASDASGLLLCASDLGKTIADSAIAGSIDQTGSRCANAVTQLVTFANLLSPTLIYPENQNTMTNCIDNLTSSLEELVVSIKQALKSTPNYPKKSVILDNAQKAMLSATELKNVMQQSLTVNKSILPDLATENIKKIDAALEVLNQKIPTGDTWGKDDNKEVLTENILTANAAIMSLLNCYADCTKNEKKIVAAYEEIAKAVKSLSTEALTAAKRASSLDRRNKIMESAHKLCDASKLLYEHSSTNDVQKMNEAAIQYSTASSEMLHCVATDTDSSLAHEFFARAKILTERMSKLLEEASNLATLDQTFATSIDDLGSKCADATRGMLSCAHISAATITDGTIRNLMKDSTDCVKESLSALHKSIEPLRTNNQVKTQVNNLSEELISLQDYSDHLIRYVPEVTQKQKIARKQTMKELNGIVKHVESMQKTVENIQDPRNVNILKGTIDNFEQQYDIFENEHTLAESLRDCCLSVKADLDAVKTAYGKVLSTCDASTKKELEEKYPNISEHIHKFLDLIRDMDDNGVPLKKINRIDTALENYESEIGAARQVLTTKLKSSSEYQGLNRSTHNLADGCYRLRNVMKMVKRNKNINDLKNISSALVDLGDDLEEVFSTTGDSQPSSDKATRSGLHEVQSDLMFQLVAFNKNQMAGSMDLVVTLRRYAHELNAIQDNTDTGRKNSLLIIVKRIILLIILLIWYLVRYYVTNIPIDEADRINFVKSILKEIEKASDTASQIQIPSNEIIRAAYETLLFPPRDVAICTSSQSELVEKMAREANRLAASLPVAIMSAGADAKSMEAANLSAVRYATLCVQLPQDDDLCNQHTIEEAVQEVNYTAFKLLRVGEFILQAPESAFSKRLLMDASQELDEKINEMVRLGNPKEQLLQSCDEISRGLQVQHLLIASPMQPVSNDSLRECLEAFQEQRAVIDDHMSDKKTLSRDKFSQSLLSVNNAVCKSTETAAQTAYLLSIADEHKNIVEEGLPDVYKIQKLIEDGKQACILHIENEKRNKVELKKVKVRELMNSIVASTSEACKRIGDDTLRSQIEKVSHDVTSESSSLSKLLHSLSALSSLMKDPKLTPVCSQVKQQEKEKHDAVIKIMRDLNSKFLALILKEIKNPKTTKMEVLKWQDYDTYKKDLLDMSKALIEIVGDRINKKSNEDVNPEDETNHKDYLQKQVNLATKWLQAPCYDVKTKNKGIVAVRDLIEQADKISEGLKNEERHELQQLRNETSALFDACSQKHDNEKSRQLIDKLHELKKAIEETVISRVVEDFINDEEIVTEFKMLVENASVEDKTYRFKLENSIAALLEHLGKVTSTARIVAIGGSRDKNVTQQLLKHSSQAELLAPKLVQAAKAKLDRPAQHIITEEFVKDSTEYSQTIDKIRDLCDQSVDPLDFVRTAGEVIQKMCEEMSQHEPLKASVITRLANRVIQVGASESAKTKNEELSEALKEAKNRLKAVVTTPDTRKSQIPDWRTTTVEILRTANDVESALNGETIFKKELDPEQPIFMAAHSLHAAVREWSARDNELVAVAKKMAVQMARLSEYMITDRKQALIDTTKSIVELSAEATRLARKLAMECTDINLRNNLLQVSERIPTIGGQLKMLSTVKAMRFNHQGTDENREAMTMLIENTQNLMQTIEGVVKAAAGASVKIRSERRSGSMRWVRKPMYYS